MNEIEKIVAAHGGKLAGADKALRRKLRALVRTVAVFQANLTIARGDAQDPYKFQEIDRKFNEEAIRKFGMKL